MAFVETYKDYGGSFARNARTGGRTMYRVGGATFSTRQQANRYLERLQAQERADKQKEADFKRMKELERASEQRAARERADQERMRIAEAERLAQQRREEREWQAQRQDQMLDRMNDMFGGMMGQVATPASGANYRPPAGIGRTSKRAGPMAPATRTSGKSDGTMMDMGKLLKDMRAGFDAERDAVAGMTNRIDQDARQSAERRDRRARRMASGPQTLFGSFSGAMA